jgi:hypothetical protein
MLALLLSIFRFVRLLLSGHPAIAIENATLRLQLAAFRRKRKRPVLTTFDRVFWITQRRLVVWLAPQVAELRAGLRERGWIEGKNLIIESRYAEGNLQRLAEIAAELVRLPVDVLVTASVPATLVLKKATQIIPIVISATDPAGTGYQMPTYVPLESRYFSLLESPFENFSCAR